MMKTWVAFGVVLCIGLTELVISPPAAIALADLVAYRGSPIPDAQIDGVIGGEWDDAGSAVLGIDPEATTVMATLKTKHDGTYLYMAISFTADSSNPWIAVELGANTCMKANADAVLLGHDSYGLYADGKFVSGFSFMEDAQVDGTGYISVDGSNMVTAEFKKPLNSGDAAGSDIAWAVGNVYDLVMVYDTDGGGSSGGSIDHSSGTTPTPRTIEISSSGKPQPRLFPSISAPKTTLASGENVTLTVHVSNGSTSVSDADVNLTSDGGGSFNPSTGRTDMNGNFTSVFTAPQTVVQTTLNVTANATKSGYIGGSKNLTITVRPRSLKVTITPDKTTVVSGENVSLALHVDEGGIGVGGASVRLYSNAGGTFTPRNGTTDANGDFASIFTAPNVSAQTVVDISADAGKSGYLNGTDSVNITVNPKGVSALYPTLVASPLEIFWDENSSVRVHVTNGSVAISDVNITMSSDGGGDFNPRNGRTDGNGDFTTLFLPPIVSNKTTIRVSALANRSGYLNGSGSVNIVVNPKVFNITLSVDPNDIESGGNASVTVRINDGKTPVPDVSLSLSSTLNGSFENATGKTDQNGMFTTTFLVPQTDVPLTGEIRVNASKPGFISGNATSEISVRAKVMPLLISAYVDPASLESTKRASITVLVTNGVKGIENVSIDLVFAAGSPDNPKGTTDTNGMFMTGYTAPVVTVDTNVTGTIYANRTGNYLNASMDISLHVSPPSKSLNLDAPERLEIEGSGRITITVHVTDGVSPVEGSWVEFSSKDTSFEPSNGSTYIDGSIRVLVDIPSVNAERVITIEVDASKPGYQPAKGTIVIVVKPGLGEGQPATDIWSLVPLVLLAVIVAVLIIFFSMMRPKKKRRGVRRSRKTSGKASHR